MAAEATVHTKSIRVMCVALVAMGRARSQSAPRRQCTTRPTAKAAALTQQRSGHQQGNEGLCLQHHQSHTCRHAQLHAHDQQAETRLPLAPARRLQAAHVRLGAAHKPHKRQRCRHKAQRAQQRGETSSRPRFSSPAKFHPHTTMTTRAKTQSAPLETLAVVMHVFSL